MLQDLVIFLSKIFIKKLTGLNIIIKRESRNIAFNTITYVYLNINKYLNMKRIKRFYIVKTLKFLRGKPKRYLKQKQTADNLFQQQVANNQLKMDSFNLLDDFCELVDVFLELITHNFFPTRGPLDFTSFIKNSSFYRFYLILIDFLVKFIYGFLFSIENFIENRKAIYPGRVMENPTFWNSLKGVKRYPFYIRLIDNVYQKFLDLFFSFYNVILFFKKLFNKMLNNKFVMFFYFALLLSFVIHFIIFIVPLLLIYWILIGTFDFIVDYWIKYHGGLEEDFKTVKFSTHSSLISYCIFQLILLYILMPLWIAEKIYIYGRIASESFIFRYPVAFCAGAVLEFISDVLYFFDIFVFIYSVFRCILLGVILEFISDMAYYFKAFVFIYPVVFCILGGVILEFISDMFYFFPNFIISHFEFYRLLGFDMTFLMVFLILWFIAKEACNLKPNKDYIAFSFIILMYLLFIIEKFFIIELSIFFDSGINMYNNYNIQRSTFFSIFFYPILFILDIYSNSIINPYAILFIFPLLFSFFILFLKNKETIKISSLAFSLLFFIYIIYLCILFNNNKESLQFVYKGIFGISPLTYSFFFAFDGISLSLVLLTAFLIPLCLLTLNTIHNKIKEFIVLLFITQTFLNIAFTTFNLLVFYVAFEAILIPMFILILIWGSRERKIRSVYLLFFYTLVGSVPFLLSICYLINIGSTDNIIYLNASGYHLNIPFKVQEILCYCFTLSFAVKMPMFPIHIWLPEAHVEAPTSGSILLAGILLKLGGYGFFRFCLPLFSEAMQSISPLIIMLSLLGIFYIGIITLVQEDLKKIIAYSSVAHMNLVIIALFSNNLEAFQSAIVVMISHGIVSGGLFYIIGALYNVSHTRSLFEHGGLANVMPLFTFFFLTLTFANISLPGTISFVGEFLIFQSIINYSYLATFLAMTTVVFGAAYSLFLLCRLCYGNLKLQFISYYRDLILKDNIALIVICFLIVFFGFNPKGLTDLIIAASFFY